MSGKVVIRTVKTSKNKDLEVPPKLQKSTMPPVVAASRYRSSPVPSRPRFTRAALLNLFIFGLALVALAAGAFLDLYLNGGVAYGNNLPAYPYTSPGDLKGANPLGVNTFLQLESNDSTKIDRSLDMIKAGGFGFVRQEFAWQDIEPAPNRYVDQNGLDTWQAFDQIVNGAQTRGLQVIARVDKAPSWTRQQIYDHIDTNTCPDRAGPPQNYADYGDFLTKLVTRYKGKIKYYQIWNEPNLSSEWNCQKVNAADYVRLLKVAYTSIKAADPQAVVLAAALAPTDQNSPKYNNLDELVYLDQMYKAGAKTYFDIMSAQIYGLGYSPAVRWVEPDPRSQDWRRTNFARTWLLHDVMVQNGDVNKPVWASEYGWVSIPDNAPVSTAYKQLPLWGNSVDPQTQAQYLVDGIKRARQEWPWLGVMDVWFFRPDPTLNQNQDQNATAFFSIVNYDFTPRPAYTALKNYAVDAYKVASVGYHLPSDPAISYRGEWNGANTKNSSSLVFSFQGDRSEVVLKALTNTQVDIKLDDGLAHSVDLNGNQAQRVVLADNLPGGSTISHRVELDFKGATTQVVGFYVERVNYYGWLFILFYVVSSVTLVVSGGLLVRRSWIGTRRLSSWVLYWARQSRLGVQPYSVGAAMVLSLALFYFVPFAPLSLLGVILFLPLAVLRPRLALGFAVATAPLYFHPHNFRSVANPLEFSLTEVIIVETAVAWLVQAVIYRLAIRNIGRFVAINRWLNSFESDAASSNLEVNPTSLLDVPTSRNYASPAVKVKNGRAAKTAKVAQSLLDVPTTRNDSAASLLDTPTTRNDPLAASVLDAPTLPNLVTNPSSLFLVRLRSFVSKQGPFVLPLGLFFFLACLSLLVPERAHLKEALREFRLVIVEPLLLYLLVVRYVKSSKQAFQLLDFLVVSAVLISFVGLYQFFFTGDTATVQAEGVSRVMGVYEHPDALGLFLGRVITVTVAVSFFYQGGWSQRRKLYGAALVPLLIVLVLSFSRGAWLAVAFSLLVIILVAGSRRGLVVFGGLAALSLAALPFIKLERITSLFSFVTGSNATRINVWKSSLQMIHDHFITGIGLDQFLYQYSIQYVRPQAWLERFISHPHNLVLDYWLRLGIIGPVVLVWLLFSFFRLALRLAKRSSKNKIGLVESPAAKYRRVLALALFGSMVDFTAHGLVDNSYFLIDLAIIFCLEFGLIEILRREALASKEQL